jgi:hypothetical protein
VTVEQAIDATTTAALVYGEPLRPLIDGDPLRALVYGEPSLPLISGKREQGILPGWASMYTGGLNTADGWVAVAPSIFVGGGQQYEGDRCGVNRATDTGGPSFFPYGILRCDYSPTMDLFTATKLRYRWKWVDYGGSFTMGLSLVFYSDGLANSASASVSFSGPSSAGWELPQEVNRPGGAVNWAAVERIEFMVDNMTGDGFFLPSDLQVDDLQRFIP